MPGGLFCYAKAQQSFELRHFPAPSGQPEMMRKSFMRCWFCLWPRCGKAHGVLCLPLYGDIPVALPICVGGTLPPGVHLEPRLRNGQGGV